MNAEDDADAIEELAGREEPFADGDEEERQNAVDALATLAKAPTEPEKDFRGAPRVDAPQVQDKPGQAIPENEPGYIPQAFPKLFPFGTGDYHCARRPKIGKPKFLDWGRHVLQWHDGRFMRHTRFRYWFLNTWLRMKTPGVRDLFFKLNLDAGDFRLEDLKEKEVRAHEIRD